MIEVVQKDERPSASLGRSYVYPRDPVKTLPS